MVANITGNSATNTPTKGYLKIRLDLVYPESETNTALMKQKEPYVRDAFVSYLRQLNEEDLRGSDGLYRLKAELLKRARAASGSDAVQEVLVSELVMQ
ncbi:flagellar basal body-associated FliL family protein [Thioclava sp. BHET1]|nr:flagellar basal body-associated FliL family protein [Thioclava sp. BHET1]